MQRQHRNHRPVFTKCPACSGSNVRRSSIRGLEASAKPRLRSPYRCRDCGERFWVISRRANYLVGLAVLAGVAATVAWNVGSVQQESRSNLERATSSAASFAETFGRAERDEPAAEFKLSRMYTLGTGVAADKSAAQTWLERAAQHGNTDAQYELGNALREGFGVVQDFESAAKWLQLAAEHGNADAQYALGQMYRAGMGVPADNAKAYMWFNLAAAHEVAGAAPQRDALLRVLTPDEILEAQAEARRLNQAPAKKSAMVP
jgi:TPR repeat protein